MNPTPQSPPHRNGEGTFISERYTRRQTRRRRARRRLLKVLLVVGLMWGWGVVALLMVIEAFGRQDYAQPADVIIVLGAGLRRDNSPGPALTRRSLHAVELWQAGYAPRIICSGGKPGNRTRSEADACAELLRANGIPADVIIQEDRSRSTEENALETQAIMLANGWRSAVIVSDGFHLFRARHLFEGVGLTVFTSPVPDDRRPLFGEYASYMLREVIAYHWQLFKETFNIPVTYVQSI
ncbi:MAG: YdcF family protein [Anaerolineae bacterium]|nr:YdcF family protein [Anaerolineae bacterium]